MSNKSTNGIVLRAGKAAAVKSLTSGLVVRLVLSLGMAAALGGCVVAPYNPGYYGYGQPAYVAAPVYVVPSVNFGFGYRSGGYYGRH